MTTLPEIQSAIDALPPDQKQQLLLFLLTRLRADGIAPPNPKSLTAQQLKAWLTEGEKDISGFY